MQLCVPPKLRFGFTAPRRGCQTVMKGLQRAQVSQWHHHPSSLLDSWSDTEDTDTQAWLSIASAGSWDGLEGSSPPSSSATSVDWLDPTEAAKVLHCGSHTSAPLQSVTAAGYFQVHGPARVTKVGPGVLKAELLPGGWLDMGDLDVASGGLTVHMEVMGERREESCDVDALNASAASAGSLEVESPLPAPHANHEQRYQRHTSPHAFYSPWNGNDDASGGSSKAAAEPAPSSRLCEALAAEEPTTCLLMGENMELRGTFLLRSYSSSDSSNSDSETSASPAASPGPSVQRVGVSEAGQSASAAHTFHGRADAAGAASEHSTAPNTHTHPVLDSRVQGNGHGAGRADSPAVEGGDRTAAATRYDCFTRDSPTPVPLDAMGFPPELEDGVLHTHGRTLLRVHALPEDDSWCLELPAGSALSHPLNVCPDA